MTAQRQARRPLAASAERPLPVVQVGDWEAAAVADASTIYLGPEAFEAQYATGAALGQPLLVLKLDREQAEGLAAAWGRASRGGDD